MFLVIPHMRRRSIRLWPCFADSIQAAGLWVLFLMRSLRFSSLRRSKAAFALSCSTHRGLRSTRASRMQGSRKV